MARPIFRPIVPVLFLLVAILPSAASAGFIDFENGWDGAYIRSTIPGLEFTSNNGWGWVYGDWRTETYNGAYPNMDVTATYPLPTQFYSDGNIFAWMGTEEGVGIITFTNVNATFFQVDYSTYEVLKMTAYDNLGLILDHQESVPSNVGTGRMDTLRVEGDGIVQVKLSGVHNQWLIDNLKTDAIQECTQDAHCDDGNACNGQESCVNFLCEPGLPLVCSDDGLFCNGDESCDTSQGCVHSGNPCQPGETCDEAAKKCVAAADDDTLVIDDDTAAADSSNNTPKWPKGKVTGGCCGG